MTTAWSAMPPGIIIAISVVGVLLAGCVVYDARQTLTPSPYKNWAAYYGKDADIETLKQYDLVVVDDQQNLPIASLQAAGTKVLAYISAGELESSRHYAEEILSAPEMVIGENKTWNSKKIDLRNAVWQSYIVNQWLPAILGRGYDGVFIDTLDSALDMEKQNVQYAGMRDASVALIRDIRRNMSKEKLIMVNRGFDIIPRVGDAVDILLAESILVDANNPEKTYFPENVYGEYVYKLQDIRKKYSQLSIFTLDYPNANDKRTWLQVCELQQKQGFVPYVAKSDLQSVEPPMCGMGKQRLITLKSSSIAVRGNYTGEHRDGW